MGWFSKVKEKVIPDFKPRKPNRRQKQYAATVKETKDMPMCACRHALDWHVDKKICVKCMCNGFYKVGNR